MGAAKGPIDLKYASFESFARKEKAEQVVLKRCWYSGGNIPSRARVVGQENLGKELPMLCFLTSERGKALERRKVTLDGAGESYAFISISSWEGSNSYSHEHQRVQWSSSHNDDVFDEAT